MEWWATDDEHGGDVERSYGAWLRRQPWWPPPPPDPPAEKGLDVGPLAG